MLFDDARIGHQAMELPPISAGGVHAQHVLPRSCRLAIDLIGDAANRHQHIAAGDCGHRSGALPGVQRHRYRQRSTQGQPLPDLEHTPCDMGVLHEREFVALNKKFRQPVHHREDAVMVTRRNRFEKPSPCRLGRRQREGGSTRIGGDLSFDEIENRRVVSRPDGETHGPWPDPGREDRIRGASLSPLGGVGECGHCREITSRSTG